jgi:uncharacterized iron-regulated protein
MSIRSNTSGAARGAGRPQRHVGRACSLLACVSAALLLADAAQGSALQLPPEPEALAAAIRGHRVVLLGEVHDNGVQHALRLDALRRLIAQGARPALAFEQFDRDHQPQIEAARRDRPGDAAHVIEQAAGAKSWRWEFYRPFVQLALDHGLPIVAANLSRKDAFRLSQQGWGALLSESEIGELGLDRLPAEFFDAHLRAVAKGHCDLIPEPELPAMARAQIGRDLTLARSIRPYIDRGVVLLTGNGHVRKDVGVPFWLSPQERRDTFSVAIVEPGEAHGAPANVSGQFDAIVVTPAVDRPDPCIELSKRLGARGERGSVREPGQSQMDRTRPRGAVVN